MLERDVETPVVKYAEDLGCIVIKLNGPNNRGKPDRAFFFLNRTLVIEFKAPGEVPTPLQESWLVKFRKQGFTAVWHDNIGRAKTEIDRFVAKARAEFEDFDLL